MSLNYHDQFGNEAIEKKIGLSSFWKMTLNILA